MLQHNRRIGDGVAFCNPIFFWYDCAVFRKLNNRTKECGLQTLTVDFFCQRLIVKGGNGSLVPLRLRKA